MFIGIPFFDCLICVLCMPPAANLGTATICKEQCRIMAHIRVLYGSWVWSPESPLPPWASVVKAVFWTSDLYQGLRDKLRKPSVTPSIEKADGGHLSFKLGDTIIETNRGNVLKDEGRVELLPLWAGCPVPSVISALSFVYIVIEVPRMWTLALHNIVAQFVLNGILVAVTDENADVRACVSNPKAACDEEFFHADVCVYNLSKPLALYSIGLTTLALCSLYQYFARPPRYLSYIQGTLTSAIPVEVFCYLLYALDLIRQNSTWVMVCTQQLDFCAALSIQSMFPVNIAVAYLSEEKSVPESFVTDSRAAVSNCDTVAPIQWERVCEDLADGFPVGCTGRRYVDQEEEATPPQEEDGESQNPPPPLQSQPASRGTAHPPRPKNQWLEQVAHSKAPRLDQSLHPTRRWARLQPIPHRSSRHRMDVVPLVVLTVRCLVTRHHKQMVGSLLERVPNQRHLARGSGARLTMVCALTAVLHVFPVTRLNVVLRCLCRYY